MATASKEDTVPTKQQCDTMNNDRKDSNGEDEDEEEEACPPVWDMSEIQSGSILGSGATSSVFN
eukprot:3255036-Ditylum_brightwellii.AAC.1